MLRPARSHYAEPIETVADIIRRDPVAVHPRDSVESPLRLVREHGRPGLPVVDGALTR
jgi:CBS domain-containing protein